MNVSDKWSLPSLTMFHANTLHAYPDVYLVFFNSFLPLNENMHLVCR